MRHMFTKYIALYNSHGIDNRTHVLRVQHFKYNIYLFPDNIAQNYQYIRHYFKVYYCLRYNLSF